MHLLLIMKNAVDSRYFFDIKLQDSQFTLVDFESDTTTSILHITQLDYRVGVGRYSEFDISFEDFRA